MPKKLPITDMTSPRALLFAALLASTGLTGCKVGPDYKQPTAASPIAYKELQGWQPGTPLDAVDRGPWWSIYNDPLLDGLERRIDISNQTLKASLAAYEQSRALVAEARAGYFPTVSLDGGITRRGSGTGSSGSGSSSSSSSGTSTTTTTGTTSSTGVTTGTTTSTGTSTGTTSSGGTSSSGGRSTTYDFSGSASWSPDVWGKIRRTVESDVATAQASAADLANARLSAQADLATYYFELRLSDEQRRLLEATAASYARALEITQNNYKAGVKTRADVAQAETQLKAAQAQAIATGVDRAKYEHAIAVLVGVAPSQFSLAEAKGPGFVPTVPPGLPSTLLQRRPDVAEAERKTAAANAQIGIAVAAYYPDITLSASYGYSAYSFGSLFEAANRAWSLGGSFAQTLFDGGERSAAIDAARAAYDEQVATYRGTVLTAFQQVEDDLAALRILEQQAQIQDQAVASAQEAERLALNQYKAGTVDYTSVITAQQTALSNEQSALTVRQTRLVDSVALIQALGGGWNAAGLPGRDRVEDDKPADLAAGFPSLAQPTPKVETSSPAAASAPPQPLAPTALH